MNAECLHAIVNALSQEIIETEYPQHLKGLVDGLEEAVRFPAEPKWQKQISGELESLRRILGSSVADDFPPLWRREVEAMQIEPLLGSSLLAQIERAMANDQLHDETAEEMAYIQHSVEGLVDAIDGAASSMRFLQIGQEQLDPGDFEIDIAIPRSQVANGLQSLGKEFVAVQQILGPFSELAGEGRPEVEVRAISSSEFQVFLVAAPPIAASVAYALDRLASVYERIVHIRLMKEELTEKKIPDVVLDPLSGYVDDLVKAEIEKIVDELLAKADLADEGRLNELRTDLQIQLDELARRVEQGYGVDVRTGDLPTPGENSSEIDARIKEAAELVLAAQRGIRSLNSTEKATPRLESPDGADGSE